MGYLDELPPGLRADPYPAALYSQNRIHIMILDEYIWGAYYLYWTIDGGPEQTTRILERPPTPAGTIDHDFFPVAGGRYTFQVQGCPRPATGPFPPHSEEC